MTSDYEYILEYLVQQNHILVGGTTGSGKSVFINTLLLYLLKKSTNHAKAVNFYLIDPKKVDLQKYKHCKQTKAYACTDEQILRTLRNCVKLMNFAYKILQFCGKEKAENSPHSYIVIDEFADLMLSPRKKEIVQLVQRLTQLGRACNYHVILATQRPTRDVISGKIKTNLDTVLALHTADEQESRNLIHCSDSHYLPLYGEAILRCSLGQDTINISPQILEEQALIIANNLTWYGKQIASVRQKLFSLLT